MKILQVIPYLFPEAGGDVNVCCNLSNQLSRNGHDVTILTTDFKIDRRYASSLEEQGINIVIFPCSLNVALYLYSPGMKRWLSANIRNFDVIHLHTYRSYQNKIIHHYARKYSVPYVLQAHGSLPLFFGKKGLKRLFDFLWGFRIIQDSTYLIALTKGEVNQYRDMGAMGVRIKIVPNGIDLKEFENPPAKGEFRYRYGIGEKEKVILYVGRLHKSKGIDLLIDAFSKLDERDKARLIIIGPDGGNRRSLEKLSEDLDLSNRVLFLGFVTQDEKIQALVDADVFVTPSFNGFPITFIEASACGTPIVATTNGDALDWIDGNAGIVTEYDSEHLRDAIAKIIGDARLKARLATNAKDLVSKKLNWTAIALEIESIYRECGSASRMSD